MRTFNSLGYSATKSLVLILPGKVDSNYNSVGRLFKGAFNNFSFGAVVRSTIQYTTVWNKIYGCSFFVTITTRQDVFHMYTGKAFGQLITLLELTKFK